MSLPSRPTFAATNAPIESRIMGTNIRLGGIRDETVTLRSANDKGLDLSDPLMLSTRLPVDTGGVITNVIGLDGNGKWYNTAKGSGGGGAGGDVYTGGNPLTPGQNIYSSQVQNIFKGLVSLNTDTPVGSAWTQMLVIEPDANDATQLNISRIDTITTSKVAGLDQVIALVAADIAANTAAITANTNTIYYCARINDNNTYLAGYWNLFNGDVILDNLKTGNVEILGIDGTGKIVLNTNNFNDYALLTQTGGVIGDAQNPPQTFRGNNVFMSNVQGGGITYFVNNSLNYTIPAGILLTATNSTITNLNQGIGLGVTDNSPAQTAYQSQLEISHPIKITAEYDNGHLPAKASSIGNIADFEHMFEMHHKTSSTFHIPATAIRHYSAQGVEQHSLLMDWVGAQVIYNNAYEGAQIPDYSWETTNTNNPTPHLLFKIDPTFGMELTTKGWDNATQVRLDMKQSLIIPSYTPHTNPELILRYENATQDTESLSIEFFAIEESCKIGKDTMVENVCVRDTNLIISCLSDYYENPLAGTNPTPSLKFRVRDTNDKVKYYDETISITPNSVQIGTVFQYASRFNFSTTINTYNDRTGVTGEYAQDGGDGMSEGWPTPAYSGSIYSDELTFSCLSPHALAGHIPGTTDRNPGAWALINGAPASINDPATPYGQYYFRQWGFSIQTEAEVGTLPTKHLTLWCNITPLNTFSTCRAQQRMSVGYFETHAPNSRFNFTGTHHAVGIAPSPDKTLYQDTMIGKVIIATGIIKPLVRRSISDAVPQVKLCLGEKDKRVIGVVGGYEKDNDKRYDTTATSWRGVLSKDQNRIIINALGEGLVWVTNNGENCENGDYICSSAREGYAQKQDDDLMHNYTIGKLTEDIIWNGETEFLCACIYHCG